MGIKGVIGGGEEVREACLQGHKDFPWYFSKYTSSPFLHFALLAATHTHQVLLTVEHIICHPGFESVRKNENQ